MIYYHNYSLKNFHSFRIQVQAQHIFVVDTILELYQVWNTSQKLKIPFLILGNGSNILFLEKFFLGIVIVNKIRGIYFFEDKKSWNLEVLSGENWHNLVLYSLKNRIFGLENLALIPGSIGGAVVQNISAYGLELKKVCNYVKILDLKKNKIIYIPKKFCNFNYRNSIFKNFYIKDFVIISIGIRLKKKWKPIVNHPDLQHLKNIPITPKKIFNLICKIRKFKIPNPKDTGNAGSFFKNPTINIKDIKLNSKKFFNLSKFYKKNGKIKIPASWLIDKSNLKGYSIGGAEIDKNKAFIINKKNATGKDVFLLFNHVKKTIKKKFNIKLQKEVIFIGSKKNIFM